MSCGNQAISEIEIIPDQTRLILHETHGHIHLIAVDIHLITCALRLIVVAPLIDIEIIESVAITAVHLKVLPVDRLGIWIAFVLAQPRCRGHIVYAVARVGDKLYHVIIVSGIQLLETVELDGGYAGEHIAVKPKSL